MAINKIVKQALDGKLLAKDGPTLGQGVWQSAVYLGADGFVYHVEATRKQNEIAYRIRRKDKVGDYLRWVDDIHANRGGSLPAQDNNVHYQAAWNLRELI